MEAEKICRIEKEIIKEIENWERMLFRTDSDTAYYYISALQSALKIVRGE